jgi:hypothetical protein
LTRRIVILLARSAAVASLWLSGCADQSELDQPLSPVALRQQIVGRTVLATENGQTSYIHFSDNGVAAINGATAEYGHWRIEENGFLCLQWRDQPERCAAVYQINASRYRVGDVNMNVLGPAGDERFERR